VFCDKATPRDIVGAWVPVAYDEPISYGQVGVRPGDHVLADCDGIVVIPAPIVAEVVKEAETAMRTEDQVRAAILSGVDPQQAYLDHGKF
jgi:Demethylmenaquinone methyltransferase